MPEPALTFGPGSWLQHDAPELHRISIRQRLCSSHTLTIDVRAIHALEIIEHPAVAESAVIGKPDPERTELVKAYVVLRPGNAPTPELTAELEQFVKQRLSAHAYPREIEFVEALPKTPSGKIQRFLLRQQEVERARATKG